MELYSKRQPISSLKEGDIVNDIFVVKIKRGISDYTKGHRFMLLLSDNSGKTVEYVYWGGQEEEKVKSIYGSIKPDSVIHLQGKVSIYNGKLQLATNEPNEIKVLNKDQYNTDDFVKPAKKDINLQYTELKQAIEWVKDIKIKELLKKIFEDAVFENKFKNHPGAIEIHHNWKGGLLQHTLEVLKYCELALEHFPQLNNDLLIAGALLHDIGKLEELEVTSRIKGTNVGQLAGHLVLGVVRVSKKMDEIDGFDEDLKHKLLHIMVSHHGKNEFGSPKEPMFPEAVAVYYADEMSSKLAEMTEFVDSAKDDTEDDFMYNRRHGKNIFLK